MEAVGRNLEVAGTHMLDNALVEGVSCDTMDLRRSVMMEMVYIIQLRCCEDAQDVELDDAECGDSTLTILWGSRGDRGTFRQIAHWTVSSLALWQDWLTNVCDHRVDEDVSRFSTLTRPRALWSFHSLLMNLTRPPQHCISAAYVGRLMCRQQQPHRRPLL